MTAITWGFMITLSGVFWEYRNSYCYGLCEYLNIAGKEIHLKHRAPVISVSVIDRNACPLPAALEVQHERAKAPDMTGSHQVVICSEEQFKVS